MKRNTISILVFLAGIFLLQSCAMHKMMFVEDESKYGFDKTVEELNKALVDNNWAVTEVVDMQAHYAKHELKTNKLVTLEICKPEGAVKILNNDDFTRMAPFMPMRVAVYEKSDGKIYISRIRLKMMKKMYRGIVKDILKGGAEDLEKAMLDVLLK